MATDTPNNLQLPKNVIAYFNGEFISPDEIALAVDDIGFTMGVTIAERFRTYRYQPVYQDRHYRRLSRGLKVIGIDPAIADGLPHIVQQLGETNSRQFPENGDVEVVIAISPGRMVDRNSGHPKPTVIVTNHLLNFDALANKYRTGEKLRTVKTVETSASNWPKSFKCRSRMHYWLALQEASHFDQAESPLLSDEQGNVAESPTSTIAGYIEGKLLLPPSSAILDSISLSVATELLKQMKISVEHRRFTSQELVRCEEVLAFSSPFFVAPVVSIDDVQIGEGQPGQVFRQLHTAFAEEVRVDLIDQAELNGSGI